MFNHAKAREKVSLLAECLGRADIPMKTTLAILLLATLVAQGQLRMVEGKIYAPDDPAWVVFNCNMTVITNIGNDVICQPYTEERVHIGLMQNGGYWKVVKDTRALFPVGLRNYGRCSPGSDIRGPIRAIQIGGTNVSYSVRSGGVIDHQTKKKISYGIYDLGVPYSRPLTEMEMKLEAQKNLETRIKTVQWLQSRATNGDALAQCSLGLHYLKGEGCETNEALAIEWLQKAATQGNLEASNKLAELK